MILGNKCLVAISNFSNSVYPEILIISNLSLKASGIFSI